MFQLFWVGDDTPENIPEKNPSFSPEGDIRPIKMDDFQEESQQEEEYDGEVGQIALDILESPQSIYILAPVAGIELADIDISIRENVLTLSGIRNRPKEFYENSMKIRNSECFWGKFIRNVRLPENLDLSDIRAMMENNLLVIYIPKIRFDSKNIKINRLESY